MKRRYPLRLVGGTPTAIFKKCVFLLTVVFAGMSIHAHAYAQAPRLDVPFVPTPQVVVDKMLDMAKVVKNAVG